MHGIGLEFTTTACARPEIHEKTYRSFVKNLTGIEWGRSTLYINIDPLPEGANRDDCVSVAREYFGKVVPRLPDKPNYSLAYKWLWCQPKKEFFFNLEDDWKKKKKIDIHLLIASLKASRYVVAAPLRAYKYHYKTCPTSPSLYRRDFFIGVSKYLRGDKNPETQLHNYIDGMYKQTGVAKRSRMVAVWPRERVVVKDIGRQWSDEKGYTRPQVLDITDPRYKKKCHFTSWVKA